MTAHLARARAAASPDPAAAAAAAPRRARRVCAARRRRSQPQLSQPQPQPQPQRQRSHRGGATAAAGGEGAPQPNRAARKALARHLSRGVPRVGPSGRPLHAARLHAIIQLELMQRTGAHGNEMDPFDAAVRPSQAQGQEGGAARVSKLERSWRRGMKGLSAADRRAVTQLAARVTKQRRRLDYALQELVDRPLRNLSPPVLQCLEVGLLELEDGAGGDEVHAVVFELVEIAGAAAGKAAGGLVNAVLREADRRLAPGARGIPTTPASAGVVERLGVAHSHPDWMVERFIAQLGAEDTALLLKANNEAPAFGVRPTLARRLEEGGDGEVAAALAADLAAVRDDGATEASPDVCKSLLTPGFARVVSGLQAIARGGLLSAAGDGGTQRWAVQDEAAGLVVTAALAPRPGEAVLDVCAAPGGKALLAASILRGDGMVVAADRSADKVEAMTQAARAQGAGGVVRCVAAAAQDLALELSRLGLPASFDRVLVDAPCSGMGVARKRPDLRWSRKAEDLPNLLHAQAAILDAASALVRPGGVLVYSTCSVDACENAVQARAFLERDAGQAFSLERVGDEEGTEAPREAVTEEGYLATMPHVHGVDGAFAAKFRRKP